MSMLRQPSSIVGRPDFKKAALEAQERSMVLLSNTKSMLAAAWSGPQGLF